MHSVVKKMLELDEGASFSSKKTDRVYVEGKGGLCQVFCDATTAEGIALNCSITLHTVFSNGFLFDILFF